MKISAKTEYACVAVLELAARFDAGEPTRIRSIAEKHAIPSRFLVQILLQLKGAGLVASTRGASGGYRLIRQPDEVTLGDVMAIIEGREPALGSESASEQASASTQVLRAAWGEIQQVEQEMLEALTFHDLAERIRRQPENMYYI